MQRLGARLRFKAETNCLCARECATCIDLARSSIGQSNEATMTSRVAFPIRVNTRRLSLRRRCKSARERAKRDALAF